jgi:hypothetical protein
MCHRSSVEIRSFRYRDGLQYRSELQYRSGLQYRGGLQYRSGLQHRKSSCKCAVRRLGKGPQILISSG